MKMHPGPLAPRGETILQSRIPSDLALLTPLAVRLTQQLISDGWIHEEDRSRFEVCFEEAIKNAIVHGNKEDPSRWVSARLFSDNLGWGVAIEDQGTGFTEDQVPDPHHPDYPWMEHGRGIHILEQTFDVVDYHDGGRTLLLSKVGERVSDGGGMEDPLEVGGAPLSFTGSGKILVARLRFAGMDEEHINGLFKDLLAALEMQHPEVLVVNLSAVPYFSSHALGRLVSLYKSCTRMQAGFCLAGVSEDMRQVIIAMHLDSIFPSYDSVEEAVGQFRA